MNTNSLIDNVERQKALDPNHSFIVQAPAGSGKTELLTQRYLVLLSLVKQPEEILAITFTKKSAAEMRARIITALHNVENNCSPSSPHAQKTYQIAERALKQNKSLGWNLLENPNRLQIQTIDSFNAGLTRQLPLLSKFGAPLEIVDDATPLYSEAIHEFLSHLEENFTWVNAIEKLLTHMDNDLANVEKLLITMLAKRDQWLPYIIMNRNDPKLRQTLENNLKKVTLNALSHVYEIFPKHCINELIDLANFSADNLIQNDSPSLITCLKELSFIPLPEVKNKNAWLALAKLLLTDEGNWRKSIDKRLGFPKESDGKNPEQKNVFAKNKLRMCNLLNELNCETKLRNALFELTQLPHYQYDEDQWETLEALHEVLRIVVAQLNLVFQQHGQIDYIENSQAALSALGSEDAPTDLTLALDYKIQHILFDEFQDTSTGQYRLLEKLTAGWQHSDGRTLFVVGDPMQSIYRFREAEVGLFIRARRTGIGHLNLTPLTLKVNFRSIPGIVDWINTHFTQVFPLVDNITTGAVSYSPSTANHTIENSNSSVFMHSTVDNNEDDQANSLIQLIQEKKLHSPESKIAILVRSRTHLKSIIPALKLANISFRAHDIEPLTTRPAIQDLLALTRALLNPADRIAWLAILRAPWCGLTLKDLLIISSNKSKPIMWLQLRKADIFNALSSDGQIRLQRILPIIEISLAERRRHSLSTLVEQTWLQLGGPATVTQSSDLEDAQAFFNLLEKLDNAGDLLDIKNLNTAINKLYAASNNQTDDSLQIMTIHNAKGLEFDIVLLPHLERKASVDDKQLLQWIELPQQDDFTDLLLAPISAVGQENNSIYNYIKQQHTTKSHYEICRLLYVAVTRAKKELHLFFNLKTKENDHTELSEPVNHSLLQKLWVAIEKNLKENCGTSNRLNSAIEETATTQRLSRLALNWTNPRQNTVFSDNFAFHQKKAGFKLPDNTSKIIGTVIHLTLEQISIFGVEWWTKQKSDLLTIYLNNQLVKKGMYGDEIIYAIKIIEKAIDNTLKDSRGLWILSKHNDAQSELALTFNGKNLIIDRTFVDDLGVRWVIDYKSSYHSNDDLELFLQSEQSSYEKQLWEYSQALHELEKRPIRMGLYFPLIPAWKEWEFITRDVIEKARSEKAAD